MKKRSIISLILSVPQFTYSHIFIPPVVWTNPTHFHARPASFPYISGDTFRSIANHIIDELRTPFDTEKLNDGDIIFLKTEMMDFFFENVHPAITKKYILITHNSDTNAPGKYFAMLDDEKIIAWFTQNLDSNIPHPKLFGIPIGFANAHWPHGKTSIIDSVKTTTKDMSKPWPVYINFSVSTNRGERERAFNYFNDKKFCYVVSTLKSWNNYLFDLARSKFVICPHGNGLDCHRTWEALTMGSIPIVKTSSLDPLYEGLPVIIVNDWQDVSEKFLQKKYHDVKNKQYNNERIFASYWITKILDCQTAFLSNQKKSRHCFPEFNSAMKGSDYTSALSVTNEAWKFTKNLYDTHIINACETTQEPRIPKIIHQIWLGSPLPERCKQFQETWKDKHPEWAYMLWTDKEIEQLNLINKRKYKEATNLGERSDIARYEILYRFGGLYIDTDFECLQPFDILHHSCDFFAGVAYEKQYEVYNGLIGSKPGHPILKTCIEKIYRNPHFIELCERSGTYLFTRCILDNLRSCSDRVVLFPVTFFYPWPNRNTQLRDKEHIEQFIKPESFALHHWHQSWNVRE